MSGGLSINVSERPWLPDYCSLLLCLSFVFDVTAVGGVWLHTRPWGVQSVRRAMTISKGTREKGEEAGSNRQ